MCDICQWAGVCQQNKNQVIVTSVWYISASLDGRISEFDWVSFHLACRCWLVYCLSGEISKNLPHKTLHEQILTSFRGFSIASFATFAPSLLLSYLHQEAFQCFDGLHTVAQSVYHHEITPQLTQRDVTPGLSSLWCIRRPPTSRWIMGVLRVIRAAHGVTHSVPLMLFLDESPQGFTDANELPVNWSDAPGLGVFRRVAVCVFKHSPLSV